MSIVKEEHKATLRKWHEELQEKVQRRCEEGVGGYYFGFDSATADRLSV